MDKLRIGVFLEGARPVGEGIRGALRGFALLENEEVPVIAKYLSERELLCEILCAQLGRELDLPIPEPLLLFDGNKQLVFGSADIGYPNLNHFIQNQQSSNVILNKLKKWVHLQSASFFDELIFNADRHCGNLLYDGNTFHLIDHGLTLHQSYPPETLPHSWENQLFSIAINECTNDKDKSKLSNLGSSWTDNLINKDAVNITINNLQGNSIVLDALSNYLSVRQNLLKYMISLRINPAQADYLNV